MKARTVAVLSAAAMFAALAYVAAASAEPSAEASDTLQVTSSISDGAVLSSPLHWQATPSGMASDDSVVRVEFLIDGHLRWTEKNPPYYYQGDDNGKNVQFLYPTTLGRGAHNLAARVVTKSGHTASTSSNVTVSAAPPAVPAKLAGTWHRKMTAIVKGTWKITFAKNGIVHVVDPTHLGLGMMFVASRTGRLTLGRPQNDPTLPSKEDGGFCPAQSDAPYQWKVSGKKLTITTKSADRGACADRRKLFAGVWTRG